MASNWVQSDGDLKITSAVAVPTSGRLSYWRFLLDQMDEMGKVIWGNGLGSSAILGRTQYVAVWDQPHNEFLRLYFETGSVGLLLFLGTSLLVLRIVWQRRLSSAAKRAALTMVLAIGGLSLYEQPFTAIYFLLPAFFCC
jgi:O-antigen ligase